MIISDLNLLEAVEGSAVIGGGGVNFNSNIDKDVDISVKEKLKIFKNVKSNFFANGNLATAEAIADAKGPNTLAETSTGSQTTSYSSEAYSLSTAGTSGGYYYYNK